MPASWIVSQIGAREHYAAPRAFARRGELQTLLTDAWCPGTLRRLLMHGPRAFRALSGRYHPDLAPEDVVAFNRTALLDAIRQPLLRHTTKSHTVFDEYINVGARFASAVRRVLQKRDYVPENTAFFGFNTACLETLEWLNDCGIPTIVDQIDPGRVEKELELEEMERWPGWAAAQPVIYEPYYERLSAEWASATFVLVNSDWSRSALVQQGVPDEKIRTVPLAYEAPEGIPERTTAGEGPLRVLWLGQVVLRKGIQYLIEAARVLPQRDYNFTIAGPTNLTETALSSMPPNMTYLGRVTRDAVSKLYGEADVFVLPTLSDGFAITQLEAMAHGVPVISTPNCGRVVTDGEDGRIVKPRDPESLAEALSWCRENRRNLVEMSERARRKCDAYTLDAYANRLNDALHRADSVDVAQ